MNTNVCRAFAMATCLGMSLQGMSGYIDSAQSFLFEKAEVLVQKTFTPVAHIIVKRFVRDLWVTFNDPTKKFEDVIEKYSIYMKAEKKEGYMKVARRCDAVRKKFPLASQGIVKGVAGSVAFFAMVKEMVLSPEQQEYVNGAIENFYEHKTRQIASDLVSLKHQDNYALFKKYGLPVIGGLGFVVIALVGQKIVKDLAV